MSADIRFPSTWRLQGGRRGVALIIVLAALVLVSVIIIAFLMRAEGGRRIAWSSAAQYRADSVASAGLEVVLADVVNEIKAGSDIAGSTGFPVLLPKSAGVVVPWRDSSEPSPNVLKKSRSGQPFWQGNDYQGSAPLRAIDSSTLTPARNGRFIAKERWNAPYLLGPTLPTDFEAPDWILLARNGTVADASTLPAIATLRDPGESNRNFVVGRFAYMIYDVGGLLDVNLAGYPSSVTPDFRSKRGLLPQVSLSAIPGILDAYTLVNWRNPNAGADPATYQTRVLAATDGLRNVIAGDQQFVSRQDLIRYMKDHPAVITNEALQYLTPFAYSVNAPSYSPNPARPKVGPSDDDYNPSLINTPVTKAFTRHDGTTAVVGEPLLKTRFPLSRLALLTPTATATATDNIYHYFGLTRANASEPWVYRNDAATILTLKEVATAGREPDFFELLQAGMLYGSLGTTATPSVSSGVGGDTAAEDASVALQVVQVGANLVDQYDSDSIPTRIKVGGASVANEVCGIENLPYLVRVAAKDFATSEGTSGSFGIWMQPEVWNPHAQATDLTGLPPRFRFVVKGQATGSLWFPVVGAQYFPTRDFSTIDGIYFSPNAAFSNPTYIYSTALGSTSAAENVIATAGSDTVIGINLGKLKLTSTEADTRGAFRVLPSPSLQFELQYSLDGTNWVTYDHMRNVVSGVEIFNDNKFITNKPHYFWMRSDPRSDRFGAQSWWMDGQSFLDMGNSIRPNTDNGGNLNGIYIGTLADNLPSSTTHYADRDGVIRPADGAYASGASLDGRPMATGNLQSRPVILNRPFRSVADMAYASRGVPWKSIDFFHTSSADAALLDLFCINEVPVDPLVAGQVNLNTRQPVILEALLEGAIRAELANTLVTATEAADYAAEIVALTSGSDGVPFKNRSELVTRWLGAMPATGNDVIKSQREASLRALAEVGETRTWNLMIDLVAQSGRYVKSAAGLNDFNVDGERRYWLHVAVDRYTGKILHQSLEQVLE